MSRNGTLRWWSMTARPSALCGISGRRHRTGSGSVPGTATDGVHSAVLNLWNLCIFRMVHPHEITFIDSIDRSMSSREYTLSLKTCDFVPFSDFAATVPLRTKPLDDSGQRLIYLAPTPEYQNKLSPMMTSYFTKWKGFHITIGGRHKSERVSSAEIAQELSEMGRKRSDRRLWRIPKGKWKVLSGKDLVVLGLDAQISMFR